MNHTGTKQNSSSLKKTIQFALFLIIAALLVVVAFRGISINHITGQLAKAKFFWVFLSFCISAFAHLIRAQRWKMLIESLGYQPSLQRTFYAVMTGYLANLAFPRLGEVTRCGSLTKADDIPFNKLLGTVITERLIDVISLFICLLIVLIIEFSRLGRFLKNNIITPVVDKFQVINSPLIIAAIILIIVGLTFFTARYLKRKDNKFSHLLKGIVEGIVSVRTLKKPGWFIFHSVFIWFLYFLSVYVAFFALPTTQGLGMGAALFLLVAGGVAMSAPVQGGIGAYHLLVSQGLLLYGLTQEDGLVFATMLHALQMLLSILLGSISFLLIFSASKAKTNDITTAG